jgi:hypothetical protein
LVVPSQTMADAMGRRRGVTAVRVTAVVRVARVCNRICVLLFESFYKCIIMIMKTFMTAYIIVLCCELALFCH